MCDERIDESKINVWNVKHLNDYEGIYFFGFSEGESQITLSIDKDIICAQLKSYKWEKGNEGQVGWHTKYLNYTNVKIEGSKFFSDQSNGEFVTYNNQKCLKLENPPTIIVQKEGEYELGIFGDDNLSKYYSGKFIYTIFNVVNDDYLKSLTIEDLQIMRNEIFARYNYIFKSGGKMNTYFKGQDWYIGVNKNVDQLLTDIEKYNITYIKKAEQEKRRK
ncbi:MAG: YARHG domain-containing protein [Flavobacteriaceae bacterium]|nr:YARHG domain-containing protein [Flavobacteriaceae bacterium]